MFTQSEITLLKNVLLNSVKNGNTVNPVAFVLAPDEYQLLISILQKLIKIERASLRGGFLFVQNLFKNFQKPIAFSFQMWYYILTRQGTKHTKHKRGCKMTINGNRTTKEYARVTIYLILRDIIMDYGMEHDEIAAIDFNKPVCEWLGKQNQSREH